jgi:hypothetical protein
MRLSVQYKLSAAATNFPKDIFLKMDCPSFKSFLVGAGFHGLHNRFN